MLYLLRQSFRTLERAPKVKRETLRGRMQVNEYYFPLPIKEEKILENNKTTVNHDKLIALEIGICFLRMLI